MSVDTLAVVVGELMERAHEVVSHDTFWEGRAPKSWELQDRAEALLSEGYGRSERVIALLLASLLVDEDQPPTEDADEPAEVQGDVPAVGRVAA